MTDPIVKPRALELAMRVTAVAIVAIGALSLGVGGASAQHDATDAPDDADTSVATPVNADPAATIAPMDEPLFRQPDEYRLEWTYPSVRPAEYVIAFGLPVVFRVLDHNTRDASSARWSSGNFFDDAFESLIGANSASVRHFADVASDITWYSSMAYPFVDTLLVALIGDGNPRVAWQMTAINVQSMALNGFVTLLAIRGTARTRPDTEQCLEAGGSEAECFPGDFKSFPSGHTSGSFTGAGLSCAHHLGLELYGGGAADVAACIGALTVASGTAIFRVMADRHHMSDVLAGAAIGLSAGWLLPWLLHYRYERDPADVQSSPDAVQSVTVLPFVGPAAGGVAAGGAF